MITIYACVIPAAEQCVLGNDSAQLAVSVSEAVHSAALLCYRICAGTALAHQLSPNMFVVRHLCILYATERSSTPASPRRSSPVAAAAAYKPQCVLYYGRSTNVCIYVCATPSLRISSMSHRCSCVCIYIYICTHTYYV